MKKIIHKIKSFSKKEKILFVVASFITLIFIVAVPTFAWFNNQKKVAELHKIKYPNALFINAAYREDQVYFALDTVDIDDVKRDWQGNVITHTDEGGNLVADVITEKEYVFSVSGSNTEEFDLQLAHTNNNQFTYEIYIATPVSAADYEAMTTEQKNTCIRYLTHPGKNTENTELVIEDDLVPDSEGYVYFQYGTKLAGEAVVETVKNDTNGKYVNQSGTSIKGKNNDYYYNETYANGYTNVQELSVPLYWQARNLPTSLNSDEISNKKDFCRYFILKVTWDRDEQRSHATKGSDMVYLSVRRSD